MHSSSGHGNGEIEPLKNKNKEILSLQICLTTNLFVKMIATATCKRSIDVDILTKKMKKRKKTQQL